MTTYPIKIIAKIVIIILKINHNNFIGNQIGNVINLNNHFISNPVLLELSTKQLNIQSQMELLR